MHHRCLGYVPYDMIHKTSELDPLQRNLGDIKTSASLTSNMNKDQDTNR